MKSRKPIKIRHSNNVDLAKMFSGHICGGERGYTDACALESYSNDIYPTLKTVNFCVIVEPYEILEVRAVGRERTEEEKRRRHLYGDN